MFKQKDAGFFVFFCLPTILLQEGLMSIGCFRDKKWFLFASFWLSSVSERILTHFGWLNQGLTRLYEMRLPAVGALQLTFDWTLLLAGIMLNFKPLSQNPLSLAPSTLRSAPLGSIDLSVLPVSGQKKYESFSFCSHQRIKELVSTRCCFVWTHQQTKVKWNLNKT